MGTQNKSRIFKLSLPENNGMGPGPLDAERLAALSDLMQSSHFQPLNDNEGPYAVQLSVEENRLVLRLRNAADDELNTLALSLQPYRRLIHDYFLILESYETARHTATSDKLEAIDMARRSLHNEGAELLTSRLRDKIDIDFETARRLFTLICVLVKRTAIV